MLDKKNILVVDDEPKMCRSIEILLSEVGVYNVITATSFYEAVSKLNAQIDLVITDLTMPGKSGLDVLKSVLSTHQNIPVLIMTAYSSVESAINAIKQGAFDYIQKPFDPDQFLSLIAKTLDQTKTDKTKHFPLVHRFGDIIGKSAIMQDVYYRIERASQTDSTVLITGQSGTGKELVAKAVHYGGLRKQKQFVALNCAAVPENLLESELFGHEKGSFTGAYSSKEGKFELANTGTLFLDEIGEMPVNLQVKLLRVLQEKTFERVGSNKALNVDVRIIAATNRDLKKAVEEGLFREDLFYRINVLNIELPALKQRKEDIALLVEHFLSEKSRKLGVQKKSLSPEVFEKLKSHDYPGNVRELENIIERAVVISKNQILELDDFPNFQQDLKSTRLANEISIENGFGVLDDLHKQMEKDLITRALKSYPHHSNEQLAKVLGTSRRVFEMRLKAHNLLKSKK